MPNPKVVIIIAGPNGCGKSTLAKELLKGRPLEFLNADEIAVEMNPQDVQAVRLQAGKKFLKDIQDRIKKGRSFSLESTLSGSYLIKTIKLLKQKKYSVHIIYFFVDSPETAIMRIKMRVANGGHFIPDVDVIRRFRRSKNLFWNTYRLLADDWQLFFNGDEALSLTASGEKKTYSIVEESYFSTFQKGISDE